MLNVIKNKQNKNNTNITKSEFYITNNTSYPSSTKEWVDSIYSYNSSYDKLLIFKNDIVVKLFKSYLNMEFLVKEKSKWKKKLKREIRRSAKKTFCSGIEVRHTNDKAIITIHIYNKKRNILSYKIVKFSKMAFNFLQKIKNTKFLYKGKNRHFVKNNYIKLYKRVSYLKSLYKVANNPFFMNDIYYYYFLKKTSSFKYIKNLFYLNQSLLLESFKSNNLFFNEKAIGFIGIVKGIYNKNIEIDIINHKSLFMNSETFSNAISFKLRDRNNRVLKVLKKAIDFIKIPSKFLFLYNYNYDSSKANVLPSLKYKSVSGVRIEASGRLTRRLTALRSISKTKYKGSLKNLGSSYKRLSSFMLRNHLKSNLQFNKINGKTRNGAFGIKCWVSSY